MNAINTIDPRYDNNIDALRLLAAIGVVFGHSFAFAGGPEDPFSHFIKQLEIPYMVAIHGISVWFLFFISGNLVSASYAHRNSFKHYLKSRFLRIFPGLFVVVVFTVLAGMFITTLPLGEYFSDKATWKYFSRNILGFTIKYELPGVFKSNPLTSANGSLWTIPLELRLYLVVAALGLLGLFKRTKGLPIILALLLIAQIYIQEFDLFDRSRISASPIPLFLIGALFFSLRNKLSHRWVWLLVSFGLWYPLRAVPVAGHLLFVLSFCYGFHLLTKVRKIPSLDVGRFGDYSYGVYLYSAPIQQILVWKGVTNGWSVFAWSLVLSLLAGIASWHLIEKRALKLK